MAATGASIGNPMHVATDRFGQMYFTSLDCVFKVDSTGFLIRVAGNGRSGFSGDGGPANEAQLSYPVTVAVSDAGEIYIADSNNHRIRNVSAKGIISTVAGNGAAGKWYKDEGTSPDKGPALKRSLFGPDYIAVDRIGNIFTTDFHTGIRKISINGIISTLFPTTNLRSGVSSLTSGPAIKPTGIAVDRSGVLYVTDFEHRIQKISSGKITILAGTGKQGFSGDGGRAIDAQLNNPHGVTVDRSGNVYFADLGNQRVRRVSREGIITTVAGGG